MIATASDKVYDATTGATVTLSSNHLAGDIVTASYTTATFDTKDVGDGKAVSVGGIAIGGADAANYALQNVTASATANITPRSLTVSATGVDKVYNATTAATVTLSVNHLSSDVVTTSYTTATYSDKNVGTGKTVVVDGITIGGTDAGNYTLQNTVTSTTANISAKALVGSITAENKQYDSTDSATIATRVLDAVIAGDDVSYVGGTATFADSHVASGILVSAWGLSLSGADAGNYTVNTTATTTADIVLCTLTIIANNTSKTYGDTVTFAGTEFTTQGLLPDDSVTRVTLASAGADPRPRWCCLPIPSWRAMRSEAGSRITASCIQAARSRSLASR